MPIGIAIVAGALGALNPCGFPLLPAYLSLYVGADEATLPRAPTRVAQGLIVGVLVTLGFMATFAVVSIPISYLGTQVTKSIPWAGLLLGGVMVLAGLAALVGRQILFSPQTRIALSTRRRPGAIFCFGAAYAVCSIGCTLPVFLAVIGASLSTASGLEAAVVFGAYGVGMATVLMALSVGAALLRQGLAKKVKGLLPYMHRIAAVLLLAAGGYLVYYWSVVLWAAPESLADDPFVTAMSRFTAWIQSSASTSGGRLLVLGAGAIVALALGWSLWRWTAMSTKEDVTRGDRGAGPEESAT
jgi:cytochrome c-type biogenesis protein